MTTARVRSPLCPRWLVAAAVVVGSMALLDPRPAAGAQQPGLSTARRQAERALLEGTADSLHAGLRTRATQPDASLEVLYQACLLEPDKKQVIAWARLLLAKAPDCAAALPLLVDALLETGDEAGAGKSLDETASPLKSRSEYTLASARYQTAIGNPAAAGQLLRAGVEEGREPAALLLEHAYIASDLTLESALSDELLRRFLALPARERFPLQARDAYLLMATNHAGSLEYGGGPAVDRSWAEELPLIGEADPETQFTLGRLTSGTDAHGYYRRAHRLAPHWPDAALVVAFLEASTGNPRRAEQLLLPLLSSERSGLGAAGDRLGRALQGQLLLKRAAPAKAREVLFPLVVEDVVEVKSELLKALDELGDDETSIRVLERALRDLARTMMPQTYGPKLAELRQRRAARRATPASPPRLVPATPEAARSPVTTASVEVPVGSVASCFGTLPWMRLLVLLLAAGIVVGLRFVKGMSSSRKRNVAFATAGVAAVAFAALGLHEQPGSASTAPGSPHHTTPKPASLVDAVRQAPLPAGVPAATGQLPVASSPGLTCPVVPSSSGKPELDRAFAALVELLWRSLAPAPSDPARRAALAAIQRLGRPAVPYLTAQLDHLEVVRQDAAGAALASLGAVDALPRLRVAAARHVVAQALGFLMDCAAAPAFYRHADRPVCPCALMGSLAELRDWESVPLLIDALQVGSAANSEIRREAVAALVRLTRQPLHRSAYEWRQWWMRYGQHLRRH